MSRTLIRGRWVVASDGERHHILENGEVVYEGNRVIFTGHGFQEPVDEVIHAGNAVVGPGFVDLDALFDLDSTVLGFDNHPGWKKARVWASTYVERGPRDVYTEDEEDFSHEYAMVQLLLNGITTALPIRSILYREWAETYEENARAVETAIRLGIRMYLGPSYRTGLSVVQPDGTFGMHWDIERGMRGLADAIQFVRDFDGAGDGLIRGFLQPDRIEGCTEELLTQTAEGAAELDCPVRLHCCQGPLEVEIVQERWGKSSLAVLHEVGFLTQRALLPHGTHPGGIERDLQQIERELTWLSDAGSTIVHCPLVSARHGDALDSFGRFRDRGIRIGLGTDTFPPDLVQNMHAGVMVTRIKEQSMRVSAADYYTAATIGGANAINRPDLGRLMPGALADIAIFDLNGFHLGQFVDPIQTMIMNGSGRDFTTVIVNGRTVVKDRKVDGVDFDRYRNRAQNQFEKLIASYPERAYAHPPLEEIFAPSFPIVRSGRRSMRVVGVNGCPGGWLAVEWDIEQRTLTPSIHRHIADLLEAHRNADIIAIDVPIGLAEGMPRQCDIEARKVLGPRRSSVFPTPDPRLLDCLTYADARVRSLALCGKSVSAQAFGIYSKIKQLNDVMTPELQDRVFEVHPEVSFWAMAGGEPMQHAKKQGSGFEERYDLLSKTFNLPFGSKAEARAWARPAGADDVLDAIAVAWTAHRAAEGKARTLPPDPELDARGLRMEMVY